jgi:propionate CoA-transferase
VLEADHDGLVVLEIAPGIDLDRDVLAHFDDPPRVSSRLELMPREVFLTSRIGLRERFRTLPRATVHRKIAGMLKEACQ